jgi:hypothetical protein
MEGKDGDDVAARLAYELGPKSLILSADRDMFRYSVGLYELNPVDAHPESAWFQPLSLMRVRSSLLTLC